MFTPAEQAAIDRLWRSKLEQDARKAPAADRHRSHRLTDYVAHVRGIPGVESVTLPVGKGLEISRFTKGA